MWRTSLFLSQVLRMKEPTQVSERHDCLQWQGWRTLIAEWLERATGLFDIVRIRDKTRTQTLPLRKMALRPTGCLLYWHSVRSILPKHSWTDSTCYQVQILQWGLGNCAWAFPLRASVLAFWLRLALLCLPDFSRCLNRASFFSGRSSNDD